MPKVTINKDIKSVNDEVAMQNRCRFDKAHTFVINIVGSPGSGKTTLLEHLLPKLAKRARVGVIEGDLSTDNDAQRILRTGAKAIQIETHGACHLDAGMIAKRLTELPPEELDILIIENVGNLVCPSSFDLGEDMRLVVISLAEGDDKPEKYPVAILHADAVVISKTDLAPYIDASVDKMKASISKVKQDTSVFVTCKSPEGYDLNALDDAIMAALSEKRK